MYYELSYLRHPKLTCSNTHLSFFRFIFFKRTTFSFLSGILTLVVAWAIFGQDNSEHLTAENAMDFTVIINNMDISN